MWLAIPDAFPGTLVGSCVGTEQRRLELVPTWYVGTANGVFTHCTTTSAPKRLADLPEKTVKKHLQVPTGLAYAGQLPWWAPPPKAVERGKVGKEQCEEDSWGTQAVQPGIQTPGNAAAAATAAPGAKLCIPRGT